MRWSIPAIHAGGVSERPARSSTASTTADRARAHTVEQSVARSGDATYGCSQQRFDRGAGRRAAATAAKSASS